MNSTWPEQMWNLVLPRQMRLSDVGTALISSGFLHRHVHTKTTAPDTWTWHGGTYVELILYAWRTHANPQYHTPMKHPQSSARVNFRPSLLQQTPIIVKEKRSNNHKPSKTTLRVAPVHVREAGINFSLDRHINCCNKHPSTLLHRCCFCGGHTGTRE